MTQAESGVSAYRSHCYFPPTLRPTFCSIQKPYHHIPIQRRMFDLEYSSFRIVTCIASCDRLVVIKPQWIETLERIYPILMSFSGLLDQLVVLVTSVS